jgi:hypothetical protein
MKKLRGGRRGQAGRENKYQRGCREGERPTKIF